MSRAFVIEKAVRHAVPLLVGLAGPSGGGKTYSALRLAKGIQRIFPGNIIGIDTESNRMKHYADIFDFHHIPFGEPFGASDYMEVLKFAAEKKPSVVIIDSMSHEHEGPGGLLDTHEKELDRLAGNDYQKRQRMAMLAWQKPKSERRKLINGLLQMNSNFIFCFRAKNSSRPVKKNGKTEIENFGFVPVAGDEFVFEMTINMLLLPHANGVPSWHTENKGEKMMMKLPEQFKSIFTNDSIQLDEGIGERLAQWSHGDAKPAPQAAPSQGGLDIQVEEEAPDHITAINTLKDYLDNNLIPLESVEETQHMVAWLQRKGAQSRNEKNWTAIMEHIRNLETSIADPDRVKHGLPVY